MKNFAPLPVGIADYEKLITSKAYRIDKTLFIKEIIDSESEVSLITRPRRFGKTLALSMLKYFFEKPLNNNDKRHLFNNTLIADTSYLEEYQGRYPVIFLTLKDVRENNWQDMRYTISSLIAKEYKRHEYLLQSDKIGEIDKKNINILINEEASDNLLRRSLALLSEALEKYYNEKVIILIDEYDTPLTTAFVATEASQNSNNQTDPNFYNQIRDFIRFWFSSALKDNSSLKFAVLTGITRLVNESIFSELNNLRVSTIFDDEYAQFFGFTIQDMEKIYQDFELTTEEQKGMQDWYDGYKIYETEIYNPWSVINALKSKCRFSAFWSNTSSNAILSVLFTKTDINKREKILSIIQSLMNGENYDCEIRPNTGFQTLYQITDNFFCYLANAGYLTIKNNIPPTRCNLTIPNKEVFYIFPEAVQRQLTTTYNTDFDYIKEFASALTQGNAKLLSESINNFIRPTLSFYDTQEDFYHGIMLGLTFSLAENYIIKSNRESGFGRFDLMLKHKKDPQATAIIIECKRYKTKANLYETMEPEKLHVLLKEEAKGGLKQINGKNYEADLRAEGIKHIYKYSVIFYKKDAEVIMQGK